MKWPPVGFILLGLWSLLLLMDGAWLLAAAFSAIGALLAVRGLVVCRPARSRRTWYLIFATACAVFLLAVLDR